MPNRNPHPVDVHVGIMLRRTRCQAGLSQVALAEQLGITYQQLQKYESAANRISASRLWDCATALTSPVEAFFPPSGKLETDSLHSDAGLLTWVRIYRAAPEATRRSLLQVARAIASESYLIAPENTQGLCSGVDKQTP